MIVVKKIFGDWENVGPCIATGSDKNCGPGEQFQVRSCISTMLDQVVDKCTKEDRQHTISCNLVDCQKIVGAWTNVKGCIPAAKTCGLSAGAQKQVRTCIDGTKNKCQSNDREREILCDLPDCPGERIFIDSTL